ncbi:MAG: hypothetical protein KME12_12785 [Trichocoleus desertorum ATA4-8-CV12]|nr:hypothetical protein [Trichocoleus desertorum ATA4-8-CV12]
MPQPKQPPEVRTLHSPVGCVQCTGLNSWAWRTKKGERSPTLQLRTTN